MKKTSAKATRPAAARPEFTRNAVAALFLERQWRDRPRGRRLGAKSLEAFVTDTGGLQIDSINVVERAHYLTTWSRFGAYDRVALDRLIYRRRVLFEYWAHAACFVPASHLAWWRRCMLDYETRHTGWQKWLKSNRRVVARVEEAIRERGPLGNADFQEKRPGASGWWSWKPATHALHYLWMTGRTMVRTRTHFQKRFDLADRVRPGFSAAEAPTAEAFIEWHVLQSLHALGAATDTDLSGYLTYPRYVTQARRRAVAALIARGEVVEIGVEGERARWLVRRDDVPALAAAGRKRKVSQGTTLLSPFDSFLWYRQRTSRLFGFDYRIEVYTPGHKRVHGYYSLPILHDGQLIGRADAKNHRDHRRLEIRHVHFEPWFVRGHEPPAALGRRGSGARDRGARRGRAGPRALHRRRRGRVGRVTPSRLTAAVRRAVAASVAARGLTPSSRHDAEPESASAEESEEEVGTGSEV